MAHVLVIQRHAHLATEVRSEYVGGMDGRIAKARLTVISNSRWGKGESRNEEATSISWTVWGDQAENAAQYLGKGSHVNIVGRLRTYRKEGETLHRIGFVAEEIDYLDSRAEAERRRSSTQQERAQD